jgi:ABC-type Na+ efflux pump permease subunit
VVVVVVVVTLVRLYVGTAGRPLLKSHQLFANVISYCRWILPFFLVFFILNIVVAVAADEIVKDLQRKPGQIEMCRCHFRYKKMAREA